MNRARVIRACSAVAAVVALMSVTGCREDDYVVPDASQSAGADTGASPTASADGGNDTNGKRSLVDAPVAGGLEKLTGEDALLDVPVDPGEMRDGMTLVAGHYRAPGDTGVPVLFEGVDNVPEDTNERREHLFRGMLEHIEWDPELGQPTAEPVDAGPLGGSVECLLASLSEDGNVICGWADEGTAAVALFDSSTIDEAGKLFVEMRADLEK
ncbi:hypothetical protein [Streptomyces sp. GC420]|uniref:hypothetical protein n=1 Tax=Streptomyces sp. GC420 TaxID=2697568 RepID=UPI0014150F34|nr:hypothetical protein [Streptomyces sp. GC420]NBM18945.1 hypothetical protein [Streptomyces sp. GC420]